MSDETRLQEIRERFAGETDGDIDWLLSLVERLQRERDEAMNACQRMQQTFREMQDTERRDNHLRQLADEEGNRADAAEAALAEAREALRHIKTEMAGKDGEYERGYTQGITQALIELDAAAAGGKQHRARRR